VRLSRLIKLIDTARGEPGPCHDSLSYHAWVSPKYHYLYVSVPKAACTKVKRSLQMLEGYPVPTGRGDIHRRSLPGCPFLPSVLDFDTELAIEILTSADWFRFCFVRNPYYRLFSAYKSKILSETDGHYGRIRDEIRIQNKYPVRDGHPAGMVAFRDFVRYVIGIRDRRRDSHWRSQARLLMLDVIDYSFIGRVEKFPEDFKNVLSRLGLPEGSMVLDPSEVVNPTVGIYHAAVFDRKMADQVYRAFKVDFEAFGYDRDSWMIDFD